MKLWRSEYGEMCVVMPARLARGSTILVAP